MIKRATKIIPFIPSTSFFKQLNQKSIFLIPKFTYKIYTKTGDKGTTSILGGKRLDKDDLIFDILGDIDEFNSHLGLCASLIQSKDKDLHENLLKVQNNLFSISSFIASNGDYKYYNLSEEIIMDLEKKIDIMEEELSPLKNFILPGGSTESSQLHIARTICRRVERKYTGFNKTLENKLIDTIQKYFNRLSDFLFVAARLMNKIKNIDDIIVK